ncbi:MAG TPA: serine hydrolase, partial [Candidatus Elarobacter sp.]
MSAQVVRGDFLAFLALAACARRDVPTFGARPETGKLSLSVTSPLSGGTIIEQDAGVPSPAASINKLFFLGTILRDDVLARRLTADRHLYQAVWRMIVESDNDAANAVLAYVTLSRVRAFLAADGFSATKVAGPFRSSGPNLG